MDFLTRKIDYGADKRVFTPQHDFQLPPNQNAINYPPQTGITDNMNFVDPQNLDNPMSPHNQLSNEEEDVAHDSQSDSGDYSSSEGEVE